MPPLAPPTQTSAAAAPAAATSPVLTAQLSSRVFRPGGAVRGFVQLHGAAALVTARVHAHVTVDSNLLTLPLVALQPTYKEQESRHHHQPPQHPPDAVADAQRFAGDAGACIFQSAPTTLLADVGATASSSSNSNDKASGGAGAGDGSTMAGSDAAVECYEREFALALPATACPTFRGAAARVVYVVTVTAQAARAGSAPVAVHLPFEVYAPEFYFQPSTLESADEYAAAQLAEAAGSSGRDERVTGGEDDVRGGRSDGGSGDSSSNSNSSSNSSSGSSNNSTGGSRQLLAAGHADANVNGDAGGRRSPQRAPIARKERSGSVSALPVGVRKGNELPFELRPSLMHGRVETELARKAQTSVFTIGKDHSHLVRFLLTKQSYQPGDVVLGVFDFARAALPCFEVATMLCFEETLATMSLHPSRVVSSKEVAAFHEYTESALHTNMQLCIPHDALPTIRTDLVCFQWLLRFEFTAGVVASSPSSTTTASTSSTASKTSMASSSVAATSSAASGGSNATAATDGSGGASLGVASTMQWQTFRWQVPIVVRPAAATERSQFTNVPHKLFTGSKRSVRLV